MFGFPEENTTVMLWVAAQAVYPADPAAWLEPAPGAER